MSHPDPLQEHYAEEILDDRRSTREQLEQEIEKTERCMGATLARLDTTVLRLEQEIEKTERDLRETVARLRDELDELDSD
jgi:septal ring factor EnvC (AmiA/AmiB activator)